jgi:hypothetical protein
MPIITLTTDFGSRDGYVGAMKGVIARLAGGATVVDLAHDVPRHDVAHAAWVVATACHEFPPGTIHVVVVDPGVGGVRRGVVLTAWSMYFVGPDNGTFSYLGKSRGWSIESPAILPREIAPTFHGRDVFARTAAALANGMDVTAIGPRIALAGTLPWGPRPDREGRIVHVDHFGNLVTDLPREEAGGAIAVAGRHLRIVKTYEDAAHGELLAYIGSAGTVEIAVRDGRAETILDAPRGTRVVPVAATELYR